jgi:hypothetical protein
MGEELAEQNQLFRQETFSLDVEKDDCAKNVRIFAQSSFFSELNVIKYK